MTSTAESFAKLAERTKITSADDQAFATHESEVLTRIKTDFSVAKSLRMGSLARGSAVRSVSDLDLLVLLRTENVTFASTNKLKTSTIVISNVRKSLQARFPNTEIGRDGHAVVVSFSDGRDIDVVPAAFAGPQSNGWPLYWIPDGAGDWLQTAPDTHGKYIAGGDTASGGKMKTVVRVVKSWAHQRTPHLPLSGFHLELLLAQERVCSPGSSLAACVAAALALLAKRDCRALQDPCGVSGYVHAAATIAKRERLSAAVRQSASWAQDAVAADARGDVRTAHYYWGLVFNGGFPT